MRKLVTALAIVLLLAGFAQAGTVETAQALTVASQHFNDAITAFNNEQGEDGSARGLNKLYTKYGLSNPPKSAEYSAMSASDKANFYLELRIIINKALLFENIHNEFIIIDPGIGAFENLAAAKAWSLANLGAAGVQIGKNVDVLAMVRATLAPLISASALKAYSDSITNFRDAVTSDINNRGTG
ncbi:hypothetical protein LCGC14_1237860 [marine sediment metagenome]|uniref:Uncharacterized protein n=1 Tax=marine sediment metagenome TaxID=412755 RepID=A0A0F9LTU2_9ZZZZ